MPTFGPKHDKIQARWALNILSKNLLEKVWWYKRSKIEPFVVLWVVQMVEDNTGMGVVEGHIPPWGVVGKEMCCCWLVLKLQEGRDVDQPWTQQLCLRRQGPNSLNRLLGRWWMSICDTLLGPGVNLLEGSPMWSCGKLGPKGTLPTSNSRKG
jgi:hypothetical protein